MEEVMIDKIKKLLALGTANNNEHEAANALLLAQKLMEKHNISQAMITNHVQDEEIRDWEDPLWTGKQRRSTWRIMLAQHLSKHYACQVWTSGASVKIVGRTSDVQTVRYLFDYCNSYIELFSQRYAGNGKTWINNYKLGIVDTIYHKLDQAKKEAQEEMMTEHGQEKTDNAIVKLNEKAIVTGKWFENFCHLKKLRTISSGMHRHNENAREIGRQDGKKINLGNSKQGLSGGYRQLPG